MDRDRLVEELLEEKLGGEPTTWRFRSGAYVPFAPPLVRTMGGPLPAGIYTPVLTMAGLILEPAELESDKIIPLPSTENDRIVHEIEEFWKAKGRFKAKGQLFKRGILMFGPPGSGKTVSVIRIINQLVANGGLALLYSNAGSTLEGLQVIRKIEPNRPVVVVIEELDQALNARDNRTLLGLLDGEQQVNNVIYLATTNYIEQLPNTLTKRPSRFDEVIEIGMPNAAARRTYLRSLLSEEELSNEKLDVWVEHTEGFGIAHLKELMVATYCLGRKFRPTLTRLREMIGSAKPKPEEEEEKPSYMVISAGA